MSLESEERRSVERHKAWFPVRITAEAASGSALARNVSETGMLVATRKKFAVGDPAARFREDKLRTLRAVRFAATLDLQIEDATWEAVKRQAHDLSGEEGRRACETAAVERGLLRLVELGCQAARRQAAEEAVGQIDILVLDRADPVARARGLTGVGLFEAEPGLWATTQMAALAEARDTDHLRELDLAALKR